MKSFFAPVISATRKPGAALLLALPALLVTGCADLAYYSQAIGGHFALQRATRPVAAVLADPASPPDLKAKLQQAQAIRDFASRELGLPDNGSYRAYAELGRPYVVWNVFAAGEFSMQPEQWCVPIAGCVNYRGFFAREDAERLAGEMRQQGFDTHVGGVPAYSTLGYFDDPLLDTFLRFDETELARLIFHELAHQRVFVGNDTGFDESFAVAVENEGVRRWLAARGNSAAINAFAARQGRREQVAELIAETRGKLAAIYANDTPTSEKRRAKASAIAAMQSAYATLRAGWGGYAGYDHWFAEAPNNARIASYSLYAQGVPAFTWLLASEHGDLPRFYRQVAALAAMDKAARQAVLNDLPPAADCDIALPAALRQR